MTSYLFTSKLLFDKPYICDISIIFLVLTKKGRFNRRIFAAGGGKQTGRALFD